MRKGHDFHKDKDVGEIVNLGGQKGKNPCVISPCLTQPPPLRIAAGGWGNYCVWEWGGRTVSPCLHTHSTNGWLHNGKNIHALRTDARYLHCLFVPHDLLFILTQERKLLTLTHRIFLVSPRCFSSVDLRMVWLRPLLMGWFVGSALWLFTHWWGDYEIRPRYGLHTFSQAVSVVQNGPLFPHVVSCVWCYIWRLL